MKHISNTKEMIQRERKSGISLSVVLDIDILIRNKNIKLLGTQNKIPFEIILHAE